MNKQKEYFDKLPLCSICLEKVGKRGVSTICHHRFHDKCLSPWLINHPTCPYCRTELIEYENIPDNDDIGFIRLIYNFLNFI